MKKIALVLSFAFYTVASYNAIFPTTAFGAFPISKNNTEVVVVSDPSTPSVESNDKVVESKVVTSSKANAASSKSGGKSQVIALILVLLVGGLGIHRFYLGYTWQGIVQLLTAGGCGIWWLIDVIRIVTGDLGPKDGSYDQTL